MAGKFVYWLVIFPCHFIQQSGQLDLKHFDPEFVREPVPGLFAFNELVA